MKQGQLIPVNTPGKWGINRQEENALLGPEYAVRADNAVIDSAGRLGIRNGWQNQTSTPIPGAPAVRNVFTFRDNTGATPVLEDIVVWDGGIGSGLGSPSVTNISGTLNVTGGDSYLCNFNNVVIGSAPGEKLSTYNGTGVFTEIAGSNVGNGVVLCAAGRVWHASTDGTTLHYSDLLDHTTYGAGSIVDMLSVWGETDRITGLAFFNSALIIFSERQVVFYTDGQGSELGIDPLQMYVSDIVAGVGCVSRWSIKAAGEDDLLFCSSHGITSIGRLIAERSNPTVTLTETVRDYLVEKLAKQIDKDQIRAEYNEGGGYYVLSLPTAGVSFYLSMKHRYQGARGQLLAPVLEWTYAPTALNYSLESGLLTGNAGLVGKYTGASDNGTPYAWDAKFGWTDFQASGSMLIPKQFGALILTEAQITVNLSWAFDFSTATKTSQITTPAIGSAASEFNISEYAIAEWGGGAVNLFRLSTPTTGQGQYVQLTVGVAEVTAQLAIQSLSLFTKVGRKII